jgi:hypothetical protein
LKASKKRELMSQKRNAGAKERAARITTRAIEVVEAVIIATSTSRPSLNREDVILKLASTNCLGRVVALQGLLGIVSKISISM